MKTYMDNTTQQSNTQGLSQNELSAALAQTTNLMEQNHAQQFPPQPQEAPQNAQEPQEQELDQNTDNEPKEDENKKLEDLEGKIEQKMEVLRTELRGHVKTEFDSLKTLITDALENEPN